ncbi:hypothetical protein B0H19DRAFT_1277083 [Mycena capillaripes]|nr:hypothetical protein B0H19DRAFT_1277083 [Mycena capillaripes]
MPSILTVDATLGAAFIGFAFSCVVFGVITNQVYTYFQRYPEDEIMYKSIVVLIWTLELIDQIFIGHAVYFYTITKYNQPLVLLLDPVAWTLIVGALQCEFGVVRPFVSFHSSNWNELNRLFCNSQPAEHHRNRVALTLCELGLAIAYTVKSFQTPYLSLLPNYNVLASLSLGAGALADIFTASALCFFLRRFRTGNHRTDTLIHTLTIYAINTGAFTASISILTLIFPSHLPVHGVLLYPLQM